MNLTGQRILVFGTGGAQGSGLVPAAVAAGAVPVRATSDPGRAEEFRAAGDEAVVADLTDTASVLAAVSSSAAAAVAGILPLSLGSPDRLHAAVGTYLALAGNGLPVAVNTGTPLPTEGTPDPMGARATAEALVGGNVAVVAPTGYLENHLAPWALAPIAAGELIYPRPPGDVIAWTAAADMGTAAVAALRHDIRGEAMALAGPQALTFEDLTAELGAGIGRDLTFRSITAAEYGDALRPFLGDAGADSVAAMYGAMPPEPNPSMAPVGAAAAWDRLGARPTPARTWAGQVLRPALEGFTALRS